MENLKLFELKETKRHYNNNIIYQRQQARLQAQKMLKMIKNQNKLNNWNDCVDNRLKGFKNEKYIIKICKLYYGTSKLKFCQKREKFCKMCCNFNIGFSHGKTRKNCSNQCNIIVNHIKVKKSKKKGKRKETKIKYKN